MYTEKVILSELFKLEEVKAVMGKFPVKENFFSRV